MVWGGLIGAIVGQALDRVAEGVSIDPAHGDDYSAVAKWWVDQHGTVHLKDVQLIEPPHTTFEMRLVPGSNPPRYEPV